METVKYLKTAIINDIFNLIKSASIIVAEIVVVGLKKKSK